MLRRAASAWEDRPPAGVLAYHDILLRNRVVDHVEPVRDDERQVGHVARVDVALEFPGRQVPRRIAGDRVLPVVARVVAPPVEVVRVAEFAEVAALSHDFLAPVVFPDGVVPDRNTVGNGPCAAHR